MAHSINAIIARLPLLEKFTVSFEGVKLVPLERDFAMVPATSRLLEALDARYSSSGGREFEGFVHLRGGLVALLQELSHQGPIVYVETDYFAGVGSQAGATFVDGEPTVVEIESEVRPVPRTMGAINSALRALGVIRTKNLDEFDSIGLGRFRSMDDWEDDGMSERR